MTVVNPSPYKIVITGAESTGKTTIAHRLAQHFRCPLVPEQVRIFVEAHGRVPVDADIQSIVDAHLQNSIKALSWGTRLVIYDTDLLSTLVYHRHYFGNRPSKLERLASQEIGDLYLLMEDDIPWVADGIQREDAATRSFLQTQFRDELSTRNITFVTLAGGIQDRFQKGVDSILNHLAHCM